MNAEIIRLRLKIKRAAPADQPDVRYWSIKNLPVNVTVMDFKTGKCLRPAFATAMSVSHAPKLR